MKVAGLRLSALADHVRHSARQCIAKACLHVRRRAIVVRAHSLTATTARTTDRRMAMSVVVKVRSVSVSRGAFDSAD